MTTVSYHVAPRSRATAISVRTPSMWAVIDGECCVRQASTERRRLMDCARHGDRTGTAPPARSRRSKTTCLASTPMNTRTKHGHSGQSTHRSAAGAETSRPASPLHERQQRLVVVNKDPMLSPMSAWTLPRSRAVRALSAVTVLCPCIHQRNYQKQMLLLASRPDHEQVFAECCTEPFVKRNCGQIARVNRPYQRMITRAPTGVSRVLHERSPHAGPPRLRRHEEIDDDRDAAAADDVVAWMVQQVADDTSAVFSDDGCKGRLLAESIAENFLGADRARLRLPQRREVLREFGAEPRDRGRVVGPPVANAERHDPALTVTVSDPAHAPALAPGAA